MWGGGWPEVRGEGMGGIGVGGVWPEVGGERA